MNGNVRFSGALMPNNLPGTAGQVLQSAGSGAPPVWVSSASGWGLTGNAGTSTLTNFIGTTDNVELNFRVNGNKSGAIDHILNNAYFGFQSGLSTTSASLNAGFGQEALKTISTANRNSAFGYQALKNSNGGSNTGIGASALTSNTSGSDNTALGKDALYINTTGSFNVGVGSGVFLNHLTGDNNVAIGRDAFNGNTSGANNVAVGSLAGYANVSGSGNVFIGYNAGYNETGSNKFILANTSTTTSPLLYGNFATNNLGIGTTSANAPLQFNQTISGRKIVLWEGANNDHQVYGFGITSNILRYQVDASVANHVFYSGINSTSSLELMRITGTGFVGIGTASPLAMLHVVNTNSVSDGISVDVNNVANGGNAAQIRHFGIGNAGYYEVNNTASNASAMYATSNSGAQYAVRAINTNAALGAYAALIDGGLVTKGKNALNTAYSLRAQNNSSSDLLVVRNDGYVGIGTNAPGTNLHVNSSNNFSQARFTHTASASFGLVLGTDNLSSGLLNYDNTPLYFGTNGANRMVISNTGNVGIATPAPTATLHVNGTTRLVDGTQGAGKVLTSDASGNATWQTPTASSKLRSVVVDPGMVDLALSAIPPSKAYIGGWQRPCINYPDGALTQIVSNIPVPMDWNGSTSMTITVLYSSPSTAGNFYVTIGNSNVGLNSNAASATSGSSFAVPASATAEGLLEFSNVISMSSTDRMIEIYIRRDGANGSDTSVSPMHVWGYRLDYRD